MINPEDKIKEALARGPGPDEDCEYYPCHFQGQDCTWCYCPFYPCVDSKTGGRYTKSSRTGRDVWTCIDCRWVHEGRVSRQVLGRLRETEFTMEELASLRTRLLERGDEG